jgi:hypothetical protein
MKELMYDVNGVEIAGILLVSMAIAIELGFRLGLRSTGAVNDGAKNHINAIQGSILGILGLLLGFALSLSLQRFDTRSEAVVDEANAIGTAYLRAQMLPASQRDDVQKLMREYLDTRVQAATLPLTERTHREALNATALRQQAALWSHARQAADSQPSPITALFIQALNEAIDSFGKREAALDRHVPEIVLLLLYGTFLMAGGIVGFSSGVADHRPSPASYIMVALIVVLVFIIVDLDRPRRGLIKVDQQSLVDLQNALSADIGAAGRQGPPPRK